MRKSRLSPTLSLMAHSKIQLQAKLNLPGCPLERDGRSGRCDAPECRAPDSPVWVIELRRIQQVEELRSKLQPARFRKAELLERGKVELLRTGPLQDITT